ILSKPSVLNDPKTAGWPLIATPWPTISFIALYLFIVKVGPKIMEKRKAYSLREVLIVYNFAMVILSAWMAYEFIASALDIPNFDFLCEPMHYVLGDKRLSRLARICYICWLSKFVEARHVFFHSPQEKQSSVLFARVSSRSHVYLLVDEMQIHASFPVFPVYFPAALNSFVHAVMYAYYGLSAIGPQMQPYLWWKAHITKLQLIQFVVALIYWGNAIFRCKCVVGFHQISISYSQWVFFVSQFGLFSNFYIQSYLKINKANQGKKD
ncbi:very long chain fatty acid elongase 7-like, partial [Montipora capricornis]|uniref:very long chain fatty acid elongase 7-like n=1 Tax=Montipora capricornis TaxID=246305 RepID=UPI0035F201C6